MKESVPLIGGHVSVAGGLARGIERGVSIGASAIQIFGGSPRAFRAPLPTRSAIAEYRKALGASPIKAVYLHAAYLVNLASPSPDLFKKSVASLTDHLAVAEAIGADGLIFHPGSCGTLDRQEAIEQEVSGMRAVLGAVPGKAKLLIENTAGGGTKVGGTIADLSLLSRPFKTSRVGICLDTAHAFEAGIIGPYTRASVEKFASEFDEHVGLERLFVIHANDSMTAFDSHHDRHENIGQGEIGISGFRALADSAPFRRAAWLLEVPGEAGEGPDRPNVEKLRSCFR